MWLSSCEVVFLCDFFPMRSFYCEVIFMRGCLAVRLSSFEDAIRSVRSVFCLKINFHGLVG